MRGDPGCPDCSGRGFSGLAEDGDPEICYHGRSPRNAEYRALLDELDANHRERWRRAFHALIAERNRADGLELRNGWLSRDVDRLSKQLAAMRGEARREARAAANLRVIAREQARLLDEAGERAQRELKMRTPRNGSGAF